MEMKKVLYVTLGVVMVAGFLFIAMERTEKINNGKLTVEHHTRGY